MSHEADYGDAGDEMERERKEWFTKNLTSGIPWKSFPTSNVEFPARVASAAVSSACTPPSPV